MKYKIMLTDDKTGDDMFVGRGSCEQIPRVGDAMYVPWTRKPDSGFEWVETTKYVVQDGIIALDVYHLQWFIKGDAGDVVNPKDNFDFSEVVIYTTWRS